MVLTGIPYELRLSGLLGDMRVVPMEKPAEGGMSMAFKPQVSLDEEDFRNEVHADLERDFEAEDLFLGTNMNPLFRACPSVADKANCFPTTSAAWPLGLEEARLLCDAPPDRATRLHSCYAVELDDEAPGADFVKVAEKATGEWMVGGRPAHEWWSQEQAERGGSSGDGARMLAAMDADTKGLAPPGWSHPLIIDRQAPPLGGAAERPPEEEVAVPSRCRNESTFLASANARAEAFARGDLVGARGRVTARATAAPMDFDLARGMDEAIREEIRNFDMSTLVESVPTSATARPVRGPAAAKGPLGVAELAELCEDDLSRMPSAARERPETAEPRQQWSEPSPVNASEFRELVPEPAIEYPFELDTFQKQAIVHIERNENVFVAAHTSAGKTVCAEYAVALSKRRRTRVIYTSPIKTLSNQKFRDFQDKFEDVGVLTGDVQINPGASCLIMTTEILRSMLYRNAAATQDVEYVVFDEVHYINDPDRGHVWEEVIIMLPKSVRVIMLSATVPNHEVFADWVGRTRRSPVYFISTFKRPVPLCHSLFFQDKEYPLVEAGKGFDAKVHKEVYDAHKARIKVAQQKGTLTGEARLRNERREWLKIIRYLQQKDRLPVIIFDFSKKRLDEMSDHLSSLNFTDRGEKAQIEAFMRGALRRLKGTDKSIPQVLRIASLLKRGVAVHHAGLMPIMKEVVEVLFCRGLIRVLFATETFAMGVNAPARSVVFGALRKHDGHGPRELRPGEYTQMAGRAGRRGLDTVGYVLINVAGSDQHAIPDQTTLQRIMTGKPLELESKFRLTYAMVVNTLLRKRISVTDLLRNSFSEARALKYHPVFCALRDRYLGQLSGGGSRFRGKPGDVLDFYEAMRAWCDASKSATARIIDSKQGAAALPLGKVVVVESAPMVFTLGFVVRSVGASELSCVVLNETSCRAYRPKFCGVPLAAAEAPVDIVTLPKRRVVCILKHSVVSGISGVPAVKPGAKMGKAAGKMVMQMPMPAPGGGGPGGMLNPNDTTALREKGEKLCELVKAGIDVGRDVEHSKAHDILDHDSQEVRKQALAAALASPCASTPAAGAEDLSADMSLCHNRAEAERRAELYGQLASEDELWLMPEFRVRTNVLEHLEFISVEEGPGGAGVNYMILPKGKCAAEINTIDSVIATEMIFEGVLDDLSPPDCVAVVSCFIGRDKADESHKLPEDLQPIRDTLVDLVTRLAEVQKQLGLPIDPEEYVQDVLSFNIMEACWEWAHGTPFLNILEVTKVREGTLVSNITRVDGACREIAKAAQALGDSALFEKFTRCSELIRRDVVFCTSLYLEPT
eukprot:TRINITY_DN12064_c0_g1_i1.p1 TRINITY_DN12064_c0_g1~~TRINITY_DN12064_c0_g1_i1.p1  ORF type:complete len:1340 (+),score=463.64 TRINITY_DN12064_c0_g1_i1:91-4020(+)